MKILEVLSKCLMCVHGCCVCTPSEHFGQVNKINTVHEQATTEFVVYRQESEIEFVNTDTKIDSRIPSP
jgi:hypothetical protein